MTGDDLHILNTLLGWQAAGTSCCLATVLRTWGASPRPPGSLMAWREDGAIVGSVSGGCIENELLLRWRAGRISSTLPQRLLFGGRNDAQLRLPCGAEVEVMVEAAPDMAKLLLLRDGIAAGQAMARWVDLASGRTQVCAAGPEAAFALDGSVVTSIHGPRWRLFVVGACDIGRHLAGMATALDFVVTVCDPREEYRASWDVPGHPVVADMPDDAVTAWQPDARSAIVTVSHDPKIDDLALISALASPAYYVAAVGSGATSARRRERLAMFDLAPDQIDRLHAPAGLPIGSRTPGEIGLSILAEMVAERGRNLASPPRAACRSEYAETLR